MIDGGNPEQVRAIAEQLFATWEAEQERKAKEARRWFSGNIGSWLAALVILVSAIAAGASTYDLAEDASTRSLRNEAAINSMRLDNSDRLARIETKIDQLRSER